MIENSPTDEFVEDINKRILPFIDYDKLDKSYTTDMSYAHDVLRLLHDSMVKNYGGETLDEADGDDGFVVIPGVIRGRESGKTSIVLLDLDLSSSGEHWGTTYLCKYGAVSSGLDSPTAKKLNAEFAPYDYCYTASIPGDIHVDNDRLPKELKTLLEDFRNHKVLFEPENDTHDKSASEPPTGDIENVTEVSMDALDFENKMKELLAGANEKSIKRYTAFAEELDADGSRPKDAFFSDIYVSFNLAVRQYGSDVTAEVLKICEDLCLNEWEIREAAKRIAEGTTPDEILRLSYAGELYWQSEQLEELEAGLAELKSGSLENPAADKKSSVIEQIREAAKTPKEPQKKNKSSKKTDPEH